MKLIVERNLIYTYIVLVYRPSGRCIGEWNDITQLFQVDVDDGTFSNREIDAAIEAAKLCLSRGA